MRRGKDKNISMPYKKYGVNMTPLPELKSGDALVTQSGRKVIVRRVKNGLRGTKFDEPVYKLIHLDGNRQQTGNALWTHEELQSAGCRMA